MRSRDSWGQITCLMAWSGWSIPHPLPFPAVSANGGSDSFLPPNLHWPAYVYFLGVIVNGIPFYFHKCLVLDGGI